MRVGAAPIYCGEHDRLLVIFRGPPTEIAGTNAAIEATTQSPPLPKCSIWPLSVRH
jgi:hypothetical protein